MKTLLYKEARETMKLALAGGLILAAKLGLTLHGYLAQLENIALGDTNRAYPLQLLWELQSDDYLLYFCAIFGALLGALQSWTERRQGLWEFLVHRPARPERIFLAKVIAGLGWYTVAVGAPLLLYVGWIVTPGHVPAPFEPAMLLPVVCWFLMGWCCYFAGMLTTLRQARWYGSKVIPLVSVWVVCRLALFLPHFWQAALLLTGSTALFAVAAAGSFKTHGTSEGQPGIIRTATALALALGWAGGTLFAGAALGDLLSRTLPEAPRSNYIVVEDGRILKETRSPGQSPQVTDPQGKPVMDPETGKSITPRELQGRRAKSTINYVGAPRTSWGWHTHWWSQITYEYALYRVTPATAWFYSSREGRLVAYDIATRSLAGSLGPQGFSTGATAADDRFVDVLDTYFASSNALYQVDFEQRTAKPVFTAPEAPILAVSRFHFTDKPDQPIIITPHRVHILNTQGQIETSAPFAPGLPQYSTVHVYRLGSSNQFAVWLEPDPAANRRAGFTMPIHIQWVNTQPKDAPTQLPVLNTSSGTSADPEQIGLALVMPPVLLQPICGMTRNPYSLGWYGSLLICSLASMLVALVIALWWMHRYQLPRLTQVIWVFFLLAGGFSALLALITARQWPPRVKCPNCGRLRLVEHPSCRHCHTPFPSPAQQGIEIFEPAIEQPKN